MHYFKKTIAQALIRRSLKERSLPLEDLETKHSDPNNPLFNDSSYFLGRGEDGSYMVVRMAFRTGRVNEYWLAFHLPDHGTFELKNLNIEEGEGFQLGNLLFRCIHPGNKWEILYSGSIHKDEELYNCELNLNFEGVSPLVNFKNISDPSRIASVIAREKWNKVFFKHLKEIQKVHLEQGGRITGSIVLQGETIEVNWRSVRDHSWGTRSWNTWKRHIWLGGVLDNGEAFNLSMISYDFLRQLSAGYLSDGNELIYFSSLPDMDSFASDPLIPTETGFEFYSQDGKKHNLIIKKPNHFDFWMDEEYYIHEGMGNFTLDGIPGMGVAEFGLNPKHYDITAR